MVDYFYNVEEPNQEKKFNPNEFLKVFSIIFLSFSLLAFLIYLNLGVSLGFAYTFFIILVLFLISVIVGLSIVFGTENIKFMRFVTKFSGIIIGIILGFSGGRLIFNSFIASSDPVHNGILTVIFEFPIIFFLLILGAVSGRIIGKFLANRLWSGVTIAKIETTSSENNMSYKESHIREITPIVGGFLGLLLYFTFVEIFLKRISLRVIGNPFFLTPLIGIVFILIGIIIGFLLARRKDKLNNKE